MIVPVSLDRVVVAWHSGVASYHYLALQQSGTECIYCSRFPRYAQHHMATLSDQRLLLRSAGDELDHGSCGSFRSDHLGTRDDGPNSKQRENRFAEDNFSCE